MLVLCCLWSPLEWLCQSITLMGVCLIRQDLALLGFGMRKNVAADSLLAPVSRCPPQPAASTEYYYSSIGPGCLATTIRRTSLLPARRGNNRSRLLSTREKLNSSRPR
ncbi:uncharacterized protein F5Z01DRAFT_649422 [Emericellopsis atlantica]|uniref:Secreted protein n=1 Tax=Emericellopsis atlantica TaxID=2614577 RepID=A0A9P8CQQ5_9HYPO|nr:uncharacterized protein F5Z01DRAFT_649422 [Emericellopsis atlantica]KAG9256184.1 hypothetical protein F5Z01DRAFT_649422 [Emericellopsis atlantica]